METVELRPFDMRTVLERRLGGSPPTCIVIGTRGKGKSWVVRDLMHAVRKIRAGVVVSGTEEGNDWYGSFVPKAFVHTELQMPLLRRIVERQRRKLDKTERDDVLVVLDDCMYDRGFMRDATMRGIFMNGRHWKIMLVVTMQYCMDLPVGLRANIDYVFLARETNPAVVERLYKNFGAGFTSLAAFSDALRLCTVDFGTMVIDNVANRVCHYRAPDPGAFRVFHDKAWRYSGRFASSADSSRSCATAKDGTVIRCIRASPSRACAPARAASARARAPAQVEAPRTPRA